MTTLIQDLEHNAISLSGEVCFNTVLSLLKENESFFSRANSQTLAKIVFDFSKVTRVDSSGIALLLLWIKKAKKCNKEIRFINLTLQMRTIINLCGLEGVIEWKN